MISSLPKPDFCVISWIKGRKLCKHPGLFLFFFSLLKEHTTASMCESDSETHGHTGTSGGLCFEETSLAQACVATTVHGGGCYCDCVDGDQESGE